MFGSRLHPGPIALDIGAASVKLLQLAHFEDQPTILAAGFYPIPVESANSDGRAAAIRHSVSTALKQHGFLGRDVVAALSTREFQMKSVRLPKMPADELASAIQFEAAERFSLPDPQVRHIVAGEVRHGNELRDEVIAFAAAGDIIAERLAFLESLKLKPVGIDLTPCATARSFIRFLRRAEDADAVNVFLEVGREGSSIIITRGAEICFIKILEIGGTQLDSAVADALNMTPHDAADLRIRIMIENTGRRTGDQPIVPDELISAVSDAQRSTIERICRDLQLCLRYFAVTFRGQKPDSVTLVGGEAHEPMLAKLLGEGIDIPVLIGNPLRGLGGVKAITDRSRRTLLPAFATVCGLALRGSPSTAPHHTDQSRAPIPAPEATVT